MKRKTSRVVARKAVRKTGRNRKTASRSIARRSTRKTTRRRR